MSGIGTALGGGICALVIAQLATQFLRSTSRLQYERQLHRLRLDEIAEQVQHLRRQHASHEAAISHWDGWRKFEVQRKVVESHECCSLYLVPHDGHKLPSYKPGQFLTFSVKLPGDSRPIVRCYSLSDSPNEAYYRCTIRKVHPPTGNTTAPAGRVSSYLVDTVQEGDILDVRAPSGAFFLDINRHRPVVLIAGGIGVTPLLSMLKVLVDHDIYREVYFFYGVQNSKTHAFRQTLSQIAQRSDYVHLHTCYSQPTSCDLAGVDYQHAGRITPELLREVLPSNNYDFFVCGPPTFMSSILDGLHAWNVPNDNIFTETFGPACVNPRRSAPTQTTPVQVRFDRSGRSIAWDSTCQTLLDLAESQGIPVDSGCRTGHCGTCAIAVKSGSVEYIESIGSPPADGTCLPCICAPRSNLVLDA